MMECECKHVYEIDGEFINAKTVLLETVQELTALEQVYGLSTIVKYVRDYMAEEYEALVSQYIWLRENRADYSKYEWDTIHEFMVKYDPLAEIRTMDDVIEETGDGL